MRRLSPTRAAEQRLAHELSPQAVLAALQEGALRFRSEGWWVSVGKHVLVTITGAPDPLRTYRSKHRKVVVRLPFRYNPGMGGMDTPDPEFVVAGKKVECLGWEEADVSRVTSALMQACRPGPMPGQPVKAA